MEYVITIERPFEEIETLTKVVLERHGFAVERTFSLQSAAGVASGQEHPGYSVFLLRRSDEDRRPLGLLTLYRRGAQTVINPILSLVADADVEAELIGALALGDIGICVESAGVEGCIDLARTEEEAGSDREQV